MKTKKKQKKLALNKKLVLNKISIASLENNNMNQVKGGTIDNHACSPLTFRINHDTCPFQTLPPD
jgi:hypothetical protein